MNEINKLLQELKSMKNDSEKRKYIENNKDTWSKLGNKEWQELGFTSEEEVKSWIEQNPYF